MKKVFLFSLVFFFAACNPEGKPLFQDNPNKQTKETLSAYEKICDYQQQWTKAQSNVVYWLEIPGQSDHKSELRNFLNDDYPKMRSELNATSGIPELKRSDIDKLVLEMDETVLVYKNIMNALPGVVEYNDPAVLLPTQSMVLDSDSECAVHFKKIDDDLAQLKEKLETSLGGQLR